MTLRAQNLGVEFGGKWIFRNVSIEFNAGRRYSLIGPSGSGKSILLKCLSMLQPPNEGSVEWHGKPIGKSDVPRFRSTVMYVPQRSADIDGSVEDFLKIPFEFKAHVGKSFDRDQARRHLSQLEREGEFLSKPQRELSGGERQIASLVRAVLLNPDMMLLDEPTSAMDGPTALHAERLVRQWCDSDRKRSTLWITHDLKQAERVGESIIEMGKFQAQ